ncbi:hypothetical protein C8J57DRAFT_1246207 [Mycena rebaudengoi]|nr:hypothetical protein C8J57DRAFT_1246207 [Mycena rebaudengoi]
MDIEKTSPEHARRLTIEDISSERNLKVSRTTGERRSEFDIIEGSTQKWDENTAESTKDIAWVSSSEKWGRPDGLYVSKVRRPHPAVIDTWAALGVEEAPMQGPADVKRTSMNIFKDCYLIGVLCEILKASASAAGREMAGAFDEAKVWTSSDWADAST